MSRETLQAVRFFKGSQVLALEIFDEPDLQRFSIIGDFFDARKLMQSGGFRSVIPPLAGNDVVRVFARDEPHKKRLEHALFAYRIGELPQIAQRLSRLVRIRPNLVERNHPPDGRATEAGQRLYVVRVMPHLESDGQPDPLGHVAIPPERASCILPHPKIWAQMKKQSLCKPGFLPGGRSC